MWIMSVIPTWRNGTLRTGGNVGQKAASWEKTTSYMVNGTEILYPDLSNILKGKEASYRNLYSSFAEYCNKIDGQDILVTAIKQADKESGSCVCELDPLYKKALELLQ